MKSRSHITFVSILLIVFIAGSIAYAAPVRKKLAVEAGRIITIAGKDIKNGVILISLPAMVMIRPASTASFLRTGAAYVIEPLINTINNIETNVI